MSAAATHADWVAVVRPPTDALTACELTHLGRSPIDIGRALDQHARYVAALEDAGARVVALDPEPDLPDAVFVEDVAVVTDRVAVITNPGAASRRPERDAVREALRGYRPIVEITPPATLDGGDVMIVERDVFVGRSSRTNAAGIAQLAEALAPEGLVVRPVDVRGCLHLKSACTCVGGRSVLLNPGWVDAGALPHCMPIEVDPGEPRAANTFRVGEVLFMAAGFPRTQTRLTDAGHALRVLDLSELQKAEAGGSCMSIVFRAAAP